MKKVERSYILMNEDFNLDITSKQYYKLVRFYDKFKRNHSKIKYEFHSQSSENKYFTQHVTYRRFTFPGQFKWTTLMCITIIDK